MLLISPGFFISTWPASFYSPKVCTQTDIRYTRQQKALLIYQKLIAFHFEDAKPYALIDVAILALNTREHSTFIPIRISFILRDCPYIVAHQLKVTGLTSHPGFLLHRVMKKTAQPVQTSIE